MEGFLLAIMISGAVGGNAGSIPLALFSNVQDCIDTAERITDEGVLQDQHDLWCIPVEIEDGYANGEGEIKLLGE